MTSTAKKKQTSISVFFPCFNDSKTIGKLVKEAFITLKSLTNNYEVIVVDDGSYDGSQNILKKLVKKYKHLKLVFHEKNQGYGSALRSGFQTASKELVFYTDGDGQYDVKELPLLVSLMTDDVDFINGIKMTRHDPTYRIVLGNLYSFIARWLFWFPTYDVDCDFRLIRSSIVKQINLKSNSGSVCIELVKKAQRSKAQFRQISVHHYERSFGRSQFFRPSHLLTTFREISSLWFRLMIFDRFLKF